MTSQVIGIFGDASTAGRAVEALEQYPFPDSRISLVVSEHVGPEGFGIKRHTKAAEGTAVGATSGAALGALVAGLTAVGAVATGGVGLLAAGPLVAAFAGAGMGATAGAVGGAAIGAAFPEMEVKRVEDALKQGSVLVAVETESSGEKDAAKRIFNDLDAKHIVTA